MKLSFPYMGEATVAYQKLANLLGHELIAPTKPTQKTIEMGVRYAPEFACFPLKVLLGTYLEAIEQGAEVIISSGGNGPCRAGYYGEVHKKILNSLGYDTRIIILDSINGDPRGILNDMKYLKGNNSWLDVWHSLKMVYRAIGMVDDIDRRLATIRPYEITHGYCDKVWEKSLSLIDNANDLPALKRADQTIDEMILSVKKYLPDEKKQLKIGIIGEIYVVMESSVNMQIEKTLASLGCETRRSQYLSDWVDYHLLPHFISKPHELYVRELGNEYFPLPIGGHARENMGWIKQFKEWDYDGIIHLLPFGCLPELMSQSIIPSVSHQLDIPVISFPLDEQTGLANSITRLEAFIDLIKAKKQGFARIKKVV
ncbi:MAG: CoA protein activase [Clostridiales bacterium]